MIWKQNKQVKVFASDLRKGTDILHDRDLEIKIPLRKLPETVPKTNSPQTTSFSHEISPENFLRDSADSFFLSKFSFERLSFLTAFQIRLDMRPSVENFSRKPSPPSKNLLPHKIPPRE